MSESYQVATAYVQMEVRGDTEPAIERQQARADQASRRQSQNTRQQQRDQMQFDRMTQEQMQRRYGGDAWGRAQSQRQRNVERMGSAEQRVDRGEQREAAKETRQREQKEREDARDIERSMDRTRRVRQRTHGQIEANYQREEKAERDIWAERQKQANNRRMALLKAGALGKTAFGSIPFVGGASDIAMAGAAGGPAGAAAMAVGKGLQYGVEGAGKASPATMERMQYQLDRLQAGFGSQLIPGINKFTKGLEQGSDWLFGKGFQLNNPQMGSFTEMRDRLQIEALREADTSGMETSRAGRAGRALDVFGGGVTGLIAAGGSMVSKDFAKAVDRFGKWTESGPIGKAVGGMLNPLDGARNIIDALK